MGTQAYWLRSGWRARGFYPDGEPMPWEHSPTLTDIRLGASPEDGPLEVQRYDKRAEHYVPAGRLVWEQTLVFKKV